MTTDILDIKMRAFEHRRQTLLANLFNAQASLHDELAKLSTLPKTPNGKEVEDIQAGLDTNQKFIDLIQHTYNPFTPHPQQIADAGNLEKSQ